MFNQKKKQMGFSDGYVEKRIRKATFFKRINQLIDWSEIEKTIEQVYKKGFSVDGRPAYKGLLLFKMLLIGEWYNLSDERVEEMVNDSLSAMRFCELCVEDDVPDHSVLSRFRTILTGSHTFERLLQQVNKQLSRHQLIVKGGKGILDATLTDSPLCPKGKPQYEVAEDRREDERSAESCQQETQTVQVVKRIHPGVDTEARYLKKGKKLHYGYKKQVLTNESGLQLSVHTTPANEHDSKGMISCLEHQDPALAVNTCYADKGYQVPTNVSYLKRRRIKNRIMRKAYRNKPLTQREKQFNKLISKHRWVVERTFGGMRRWFQCGKARYKGLAKTHTQHLLEAIAYNLYCAPGLVIAQSKK